MVILTTLTREIQCESLFRMRQSVIWYNGSKTVYSLTNNNVLCYKKREIVLRQIWKTTKKPPFKSGQKKLWKRIPHLMQQHMTSRKGYNYISLDIIQYTNAKEKEKRAKRMTDWPRMIQISSQSPKYLLNNPHNHNHPIQCESLFRMRQSVIWYIGSK